MYLKVAPSLKKKGAALQANLGVENLTTLSKGRSQSQWTTYTAPAYIVQ